MLPWFAVVFGEFLDHLVGMTGFDGSFKGGLEIENIFFGFASPRIRFGGNISGRLEVPLGWFTSPYPSTSG